MIKKLYIFNPEFDVSTVLPNSTLLTSTQPYLDGTVYHTSVGDMLPADIVSMSKLFDEIEFISHGFDFDSPTWLETKILLNYLSHRFSIVNFAKQDPETFTNSVNNPFTDTEKLWVFGCSHSHGVGLTTPDQRFGSIVSNHLNLPAVFVTQPGSSLQWSLRHLVNANLGNNDTIIWQLTTPHRLTIYNQTLQETMLSNSNNRCLLDVFNDQQIFFHHCSLINYGVRYLRSKNLKFVMVSILDQQKYFYRYIDEYTKYPEYCYTPGTQLDLGTDNLHLGPLSHQAIANSIVDKLQCKDE